jgi:hypothetical protein
MSYPSDQISALYRVYNLRNDYKISSVNLSLGADSYTTNCDVDANYTAEKAAIDTLRSVGIATVIASGNDGTTNAISGPACISSAISVGATNKSDVVASYSNSASILNLLAPGSTIYSSLPGGSYGYLSGTSMATPHVAGAWAVIKSAKPTASVTEVLNTFISTGKNITDVRNNIIKPRIQLAAAVNAIATNGVCGSSNNGVFNVVPATNLCLLGTTSAVSGISPWIWTCKGSNGGTTADCAAYATSQLVTLAPFPQNFDSGFIAPALPVGWSSVGSLDPLDFSFTSMWQTNVGTAHPVGKTSHSPNNLVYFNSYDVSSRMTAYLVSPPFSLSGKVGGKVSFWMYHDTEYRDADSINIYVNSASNLTGASKIGTVYRYDGTTGWFQYTFDIPSSFAGATNYLLINGVSDHGNDIHLDDITVYAFTSVYPLSYTFAGTGYGSINSTPSGISCTGTTGGACARSNFNGGTEVVLSASPDSSSAYNSTFTNWTTNTSACLGTGSCSVTMNGRVNVTGTFTRDKLVKITPTGVIYDTILDAYSAAAASGQTIQVRDNSSLTPFGDALTINKSVTLIGGFDDANFAGNAGYTATKGKVIVSGENGVLKVQKITIRATLP